MADPCVANELAWCQHVPTRIFDAPADPLISYFASDVILAIVAGSDWVPDVALGHVVVPTAAIRDEGTSYHYLPAARTVEPSADAVAAILDTLKQRGIAHVTGTTWTTDAPYRETRDKMARRVEEGCLTVEMEAAAFFAVAQFRGVSFGQVLYAGDDLSGDAWDSRDWDDHASGREMLFHLAAESVLQIR